MSLLHQATRGAIWTYGAFMSGSVFTLVSTAVLARLLVPEDFGVFVFAMLLLSFVEILRDFGFKDALIYTSEKIEESANTAFVVCVLIGLGQFALLFLVAPLAADFLEDPRIVDVIRALAITFLFNSLVQIHDAMLRKRLEFFRLSLVEIIALALKATATILLAFAGFGIWSLVVGQIVSTLVRTIMLWVLADWHPTFRCSLERARSLWRFGSHMVAQNLIGTLGDRFDQFAIGVLIGESTLGFYFVASRIPELVTSGFGAILTKVLFPSFASINQDRRALIEAFRVATKFIALITWPSGLGLVVVAPELIHVVFGGQWDPAIPLMQVLAGLGVANTLPWAAGDIFKAMGRPEINTKVFSAETAVTLPVLWLIAQYTGEALAVVSALLCLATLFVIIRLAITTRVLGFSPLDYIAIFRTPFIAGAIMVSALAALRWLVAGLNETVMLLVLVAVGVVVYAVSVWVFDRAAMAIIRNAILDLIRGNEKPSE